MGTCLDKVSEPGLPRPVCCRPAQIKLNQLIVSPTSSENGTSNSLNVHQTSFSSLFSGSYRMLSRCGPGCWPSLGPWPVYGHLKQPLLLHISSPRFSSEEAFSSRVGSQSRASLGNNTARRLTDGQALLMSHILSGLARYGRQVDVRKTSAGDRVVLTKVSYAWYRIAGRLIGCMPVSHILS